MIECVSIEKALIKRLAYKYMEVKEYIINQGFSYEIDWQYDCSFNTLTESGFISEAAWVILNCGMKEKIISQKYPSISRAFFNWKSAKLISNNSLFCRTRALQVFNNRLKIDAIIFLAKYVSLFGFEYVLQQISLEGVNFLQKFAYLGPVTSLHLAKNIGLPCVKPDRHLTKIAHKLGFENPKVLCESIAKEIEESPSVVDIVLWRYATLTKNYIDQFTF